MKGFRGPDTWPAATIDHVADPFFVDIEVVWDCGGSSHPVFRLIPTGSRTADGSELYFMGLAGHFQHAVGNDWVQRGPRQSGMAERAG